MRGIDLELGYPGKLRPMMIEQSRTEYGVCITVYAGVRGEFLAAGVPPHLIPTEGSVEFEIRRQVNGQLLRATMSFIGGDQLELEIDWGDEIQYEDGHPAICELARMMLIDIGNWSRNHSLPTPDLEQPIKELMADRRATDFRPAKDAPRLQISADFYARLGQISQYVYQQVRVYGEVFQVPDQDKKAQPERKGVRLVVSNNTVQP